mmetsp:Transcript_2243/g.7085  ORF Transcript_2243/g.7085 Transcript_2243/m.7085 type:complete len:273 (+) Transcript_2243:180-998(+)
MKMTKLRGFAGALVAAILLTQTVCYAREVDHLMDEIKNVISTGIAESTQSTGMMIHSVRNTGRELALGQRLKGMGQRMGARLAGSLDFSTDRPYPWWALPESSYEGELPKWSRPGLNTWINERVDEANTQLQEAYANYEREYCTDYGPTVESEWKPAQFNGGGCSLSISLGGCYVYPVDGPDKKKLPVVFAVNCTTPTISVTKNKPTFQSAYKSPTEFTFRSCRGKSVTLGEEKTNFLQFPGSQFVIPFMSLPRRFPPKLGLWTGLGRFLRK